MVAGSVKGYKFENFIFELFTRLGYKVIKSSDSKDYDFDLYASDSSSQLAIEMKYSREKRISPALINNSVKRIFALRASDENAKWQPVLVLSGVFTHTSPKSDKRDILGVKIIDISNLLHLTKNYPDLSDKLLDILEFSTVDIVPKEPEISLPENENIPFGIEKNRTEHILELVNRIKNWNNKNHTSGEYEQLCIETLKTLFPDELMLWREQSKSNDDLYRFDLICKIKEDVENGLWTFVQQFFNTKYILFEFKNYSNKITQKEIYTTEKYLYLRALRGVAIIVSCKGEDSNAQKAIRGILREAGKVILSISNDDLVEMLILKSSDKLSSEYLYEKLDELLIDLEK